MEISVKIEFKDDTGAVLKGESGATGVLCDPNEGHIGLIREYVSQAVLALGFTPKVVYEAFGIEAGDQRKDVLLRAAFDLLTIQHESRRGVVNILDQRVFYDDADCSGSCLRDDIKAMLDHGV